MTRSRTRRFALLLFPLFLLLTACTGYHVRQEVTLPSLQRAWPPIRDGADREALATSDDVARNAIAVADAAMLEGNEVKLALAAWPVIDRLAEADIVRRTLAGGISPGVAESLRERLTRFAEARGVFLRITP